MPRRDYKINPKEKEILASYLKRFENILLKINPKFNNQLNNSV